MPKSYIRPYNLAAKTKITAQILSEEKINTVCEAANCPNRGVCFSHGTASILALGNICTRNCLFCAMKKGNPSPIDESEPQRLANAVKRLNLSSVVITSPTRDDLDGGGAKYLADCVFAIKKDCPNCEIEVLIPDFGGDENSLKIMLELPVNCLSHNIEMPKILYKTLRDFFFFSFSNNVLKFIKQNSKIPVKTGFMLGLGETENEIFDLIKILAEIQVDILTVGQYFKPTKTSFCVQKYYVKSEFEKFAEFAENTGIKNVQSDVFVRSSYKNQ
jgi:lipoic acid synthetase